MSKAPSMQIFAATVRKIDINPYVKVPDRIVRRLHQDANKETGPIPVTGKLRGKPFSTTVVRFRGMWRLYLNTAMRREASVEVGDKVNVGVRFDNTLRTEPSPRKFTLALSRNKKAKTAFEKLAPSRRKEILRYLNSLKQQETLERNIGKIIQLLQGKEVQGLVAVTRTR
jgi:hypothetical protein